MKQSKIKRHNHPFSQKSQAQGISPSLSPSRVSELLHLHGHCSTQLLQHCSPSTPALGSADSCSQSQPRYSVGFSSTHTHSPIALRLLFYSPFPVSRVLWSFLLFSLPVSSLEAGDPSTKQSLWENTGIWILQVTPWSAGLHLYTDPSVHIPDFIHILG